LAGLLASPLAAAAPVANMQIIRSVPVTRTAAHFRVLVLEAMAVKPVVTLCWTMMFSQHMLHSLYSGHV
jgi:hypothetical protein